MTKKKWSAGIADEAWKVHICSRDFQRAEETLNHICHIMYVVTDETRDEVIAELRKKSGAEIVDAIEDYKASCIASVNNALKKAANE